MDEARATGPALADTVVGEPERPSAARLMLDVDRLNAFLGRVFGPTPMIVRHAEPARVVTTMATTRANLRPGGIISGPTLMTLADVAAYLLVIAHIGEQPMAVTSSLTMHFLTGAAPGELHAQARLLKLGRRLATSEVELWTTPGRIAAHATVVYALPVD